MRLEAFIDAPALRVLDAVPTPMSASDADARLVYANPAFCREFGVTLEQVIGRLTPDSVPRTERARVHEAWARWKGGATSLLRLQLPSPLGGLRPYLMVPGPILDGRGRFLGVVGTFLRADSVAVGTTLGARAPLGALLAEIERAAAPAEEAPADDAADRLARRASLTERERSVLRLFARGDRVANIAERLAIRPVTVRNHLKSIYRKAGVHGQRELLACLRRR